MENKITQSVTEEDLGFLIYTVACFRMILRLNSLTDVLVIQISPCNFKVILHLGVSFSSASSAQAS